MPSATIHYFSGTGNTYRVATIIGQKLEESGYGVRLLNVEKEEGKSPGPADLDVFAFPVYAMDMPDIMVNHIRRLPRVNGGKAAVIAVHGKLVDKSRVPGDVGDPGYSHGHAFLRLKMKGYDVFFTASVGYPHSITMLLTAPSPSEQRLIWTSSDRRVEEFGASIAAGKRSRTQADRAKHRETKMLLYQPERQRHIRRKFQFQPGPVWRKRCEREFKSAARSPNFFPVDRRPKNFRVRRNLDFERGGVIG
jgi:hypothetical protein